MAPSPDPVRVAAAVDARLAWVHAVAWPPGTAPPGRVTGDVRAAACAGGDPLAAWRADTLAGWERWYAADPGEHVAAAFVLQWYAEVLALPMTAAAAAGPWLLDPDRLSYDTDPGGNHPVLIGIGGPVGSETEQAVRWERARAAYAEHLGQVAATFAPGVRMGSRQRGGIVRDVWASARRRATGLDPTIERESCCFIFRLPGCHECAGCPRLRRHNEPAGPS